VDPADPAAIGQEVLVGPRSVGCICCGLHLSALRLALIGGSGLKLDETVQAIRLTLDDPGLTLPETGLRSSAPAHA
jgi:hypothetical protein